VTVKANDRRMSVQKPATKKERALWGKVRPDIKEETLSTDSFEDEDVNSTNSLPMRNWSKEKLKM